MSIAWELSRMNLTKAYVEAESKAVKPPKKTGNRTVFTFSDASRLEVSYGGMKVIEL